MARSFRPSSRVGAALTINDDPYQHSVRYGSSAVFVRVWRLSPRRAALTEWDASE